MVGSGLQRENIRHGAIGIRIAKTAISLALASAIVLMSMPKIPSAHDFDEIDREAFISSMEEMIPVIMNAYNIPGASIAIAEGGEITWEEHFGTADTGNGKAMGFDNILRAESISKSVTAAGVMTLVEKGILELDRPVSAYIEPENFPMIQDELDRITIRQLLTHRAGLHIGDFMEKYSPYEEKPTLLENLQMQARMVGEPGTTFNYSNVSYNMLEYIIETVTGDDFSDFMKRNVLTPAGMDSSGYGWDQSYEGSVPNGHNIKGEEIPPYVYSYEASGGLMTTAGDIAKFLTNLYGKESILSSKTTQKMTETSISEIGVYSLVFDGYGFGCYVEKPVDGETAVSHGGQGAGWMTHYHFVPNTGDGMVILTNSQRSWPFIAFMLRNWARWSGYVRPGMSGILYGVRAIMTATGVVWFFSIYIVLSLYFGLRRKKRVFAPLDRKSMKAGMVSMAFSVIAVGLLIWAATREYLFISSVFPHGSERLWLALILFSLILGLNSLFPRSENFRGIAD